MSSLLKCEYCNKSFSTKSNLNTHKKTSKSCMNNIEKLEYKCEYCNKNFSNNNGLVYHLNICDTKKDKIIETYSNDIRSYTEELQKLRTTIAVLETRLESSDKQLETYKTQIEKYERQIEIFQTHPKTKTTNKTTINNDKSIIFNQYFTSSDLANGMKDFDENHIAGGMTFLAAYVKEKFLTKDGNLIYTCTDAARQFFKFMYEGIEIKDKTAMMLVKTLKPAIVDKVSKIIKYLHETKERLDSIPKTRRTDEEKDKLALTNFLIENKVYKFDVDVRELEKNHMLSLELSRII